MRMGMLRFASLLAATIVAASWSIARPTSFPQLSEGTMAKITGTNQTQNGTSGYGCPDAVVAANGAFITTANCGNTPNGNLNPVDAKNKQCFLCTGAPNATGSYSDKNGQPIMDTGKLIDCSKNPTTGGPSNFSTNGYCGQGANGFGSCTGYSAPTGNACPGSFEQYNPQPPPINPGGP